MHTHTHTRTHARARTHTRTHARTVMQVGYIYLAMPPVLMLVAVVAVPRLVNRYFGLQKSITFATLSCKTGTCTAL